MELVVSEKECLSYTFLIVEKPELKTALQNPKTDIDQDNVQNNPQQSCCLAATLSCYKIRFAILLIIGVVNDKHLGLNGSAYITSAETWV